MEDLAETAGHCLDWTRSSPALNNTVAIAAAHGDYEPMRALLTVAAGGTTGIDRPVTVLDNLDKYLHAQAWARTGLVFGTDAEKQIITGQLRELDTRIADVAGDLRAEHPERASTIDQPATDRWRGIVSSIHPSLTRDELWPDFAAELDASAAAGIDVAHELPRMASPDTRTPTATPASTPAPSTAPTATEPTPSRPAPAQDSAYPGGYTADPATPTSAPPVAVAAPIRGGPRR